MLWGTLARGRGERQSRTPDRPPSGIANVRWITLCLLLQEDKPRNGLMDSNVAYVRVALAKLAYLASQRARARGSDWTRTVARKWQPQTWHSPTVVGFGPLQICYVLRPALCRGEVRTHEGLV